MTVVSRTFEELKEILRKDGYNLVSTDFFNDHNRIIFAKHGHSFALQYRRVYFYPFLVTFLRNLGIEVPADCMNAYSQQQANARRSN